MHVLSRSGAKHTPPISPRAQRGALARRPPARRLARVTNQVSNEARVIPLRPAPARPADPESSPARNTGNTQNRENAGQQEGKEPLWRDLVGEVLRRERRSQERTLKDVA